MILNVGDQLSDTLVIAGGLQLLTTKALCHHNPCTGLLAPRERERERERLSERYRKKMPFLGQAAKRQVPLPSSSSLKKWSSH